MKKKLSYGTTCGHSTGVSSQEICTALGAPQLISVGGAEEVMKELKAYDAPDALDAVYQDVIKFIGYR